MHQITSVPTAPFPPRLAYPASSFVDPSVQSFRAKVLVDVERPEDIEARESLLDRAFGPARFAKTCQRLRAGRLAAADLSLVARTHKFDGGADGADSTDGNLLGTVRLWHVAAGDLPALVLGPLAVEEAWRCHKVGARLMEAAIARATDLGHTAIILVGDAAYYARFGFARRPALGLRMPGPVEDARFLARELVPGALRNAKGLVRATGAVALKRSKLEVLTVAA